MSAWRLNCAKMCVGLLGKTHILDKTRLEEKRFCRLVIMVKPASYLNHVLSKLLLIWSCINCGINGPNVVLGQASPTIQSNYANIPELEDSKNNKFLNNSKFEQHDQIFNQTLPLDVVAVLKLCTFGVLPQGLIEGHGTPLFVIVVRPIRFKKIFN